YHPTVPQLVMLNECWSLLPYADDGFALDPKSGVWKWTQGTTKPTYNFGHAFRAAGTNVVFGYASTATTLAIVENSIPFLRRMFGGFSSRDLPPAPLAYWPTCMGAQTFFRDPKTPELPKFAMKNVGISMYTMYGFNTKNLLFRKECPEELDPHA